MSQRVIASVCCLLAAQLVTLLAESCTSRQSSTCFQDCDSGSCQCGRTVENIDFTICNQTCQSERCKVLMCSSGTCNQKCSNCHMVCTEDVSYCSQQCLSGACSFKCNARHCVQECNGKRCTQVTSGSDQLLSPRAYLAILAGLFASTTILTFLALVLSCSKTEFWHKRVSRLKTHFFTGGMNTTDSKSSVV